MVILVVFNSFNVVKILKKPDLAARQKPSFYTTVMIIFYIFSKRFFVKCKGLSDAGVVSITKKEYGFAVHFL